MSNFCTNCGSPLEDGQICECQTNETVNNMGATPPTMNTPPPVQQPNNPNQQQMQPSDNSKIYKVLSYIGILWLIGMFVEPDKNDPKVRFHVGQGIILFIAEIVIGIVIGIISGILGAVFAQNITLYGYTYGSGVSGIGLLLMGLLSFIMWVSYIVLTIIGIMNAVKDVEKPLPIIGRFAFYK